MANVSWKVIALVILAVVGVALIVIGGSLIPYFQRKYQLYLKEKFSLESSDTDAYKTWQKADTSHTLYEFFVFNVTNHRDVMHKNATPNVKQIGPFTYRINTTRIGATIDSTGKELTYTQIEDYEFDQRLSFGNDSINITTVNIPILTLATLMKGANKTVMSNVNDELNSISDAHLFTSVMVKDLIWGYESDALKRTSIFLKYYYNLTLFNDTTFGLNYKSGQKKQTKTERFTISTGSDELNTVRDIHSWNNKSTLNYWASKFSNAINGTDSTGWHPYVDKSTHLYGFNSDWCRSLYFVYRNQSESRSVTSWRYTMPEEVLVANKSSGFCVYKKHCPDPGVLNITACSDNYPIYLSQPHFYQASKRYQQAVTGLTSNATKHATNIDIEPVTGSVIESQRKVQYNIEISHSFAFNETERFKRSIIFPIAWKQVSFNMSADDLDRLKTTVHDLQWTKAYYQGIEYGLIALGGAILILFFILLIIFLLCRRTGATAREGERQPLLA